MMKLIRAGLLGAVAMASALAVSACDRQAAKPGREEVRAGGEARVGARAARRGEREAAREGRGANDVGPMHADGKPMWAGNRRRDPDQQAERQFERYGSDFGATTKAAYVDKVHAFVSSPPAGVQTAKRGNGDTLFYDPKTNTFAVVTRRGAPRTMFKPRDGKAYWTEQLASLDEYGRGRRNRGDRAQARRDRGGGGDEDATG